MINYRGSAYKKNKLDNIIYIKGRLYSNKMFKFIVGKCALELSYIFPSLIYILN